MFRRFTVCQTTVTAVDSFTKGKTMTRRNGFTLVELVVVILILGILAGVAAPKMLNTSSKATDNGLKQTLAIVRDAIELHMAQLGTLPPCTSPTGVDFKLAVQKYIRGPFPKSPLAAAAVADQVKPITGATTPDAGTGWMYNTGTGEFILNNSTTTASDSAVTYNQF
jgi:prepilin-type N-terminal cleavage/methylation domain-containing protein